MFNIRNYEHANHLAQKTLNEYFEEPNSLYVAAHYLVEKHHYGLAQAIYRVLVERFPERQEAWNQLGRCYQEGHDPHMAYLMFRRSLQMKPRNFPALNNMGLIHINQCEPEEAIKMTTRALALDEYSDAERREATENMSLAYLGLRQWEKGFSLAEESMGFHPSRKELIYGGEPRWTGESDRTVIAYGEQGIGDEIAFGSCLPDLIDVSRKVIVDCDPKLEGLFRRSFPAADVYGTRFIEDSCEWYDRYKVDNRVSFSSIPKYFRKKDEDFPGTQYLVADPERRIQWRALFDTLPGKKVGIAWNGGIQITGRVRRSLTLDQLSPILSQDCTFVSLEYVDRTDEIEAYNKKTGTRIRHFPYATLSRNYDDVAALVAELDLVISVQTAVVHLCGALGKECWLMTPPRPRWFYMGDEPSVPWYKSVKIYRYGDKWPIARLAKQLRDWLRQ